MPKGNGGKSGNNSGVKAGFFPHGQAPIMGTKNTRIGGPQSGKDQLPSIGNDRKVGK
jgi:hypothetical protein